MKDSARLSFAFAYSLKHDLGQRVMDPKRFSAGLYGRYRGTRRMVTAYNLRKFGRKRAWGYE